MAQLRINIKPVFLKNNMEKQPLVSIIIATYNKEKYIKRAIDSVLNQTYKNIEVIIVDGSSNKRTEEVIKPYLSDSRIQYIHQKEIHTNTVKDRGNIAKARDKGIKLRGENILLLSMTMIFGVIRKN